MERTLAALRYAFGDPRVEDIQIATRTLRLLENRVLTWLGDGRARR